MKRVVSLVPSWTETLIEARANVVGRTRFCIHPDVAVRSISVIGGTKSFDLEKLRSLKPDLILLDREENTKEMAELAQTVAPIHVTHVENVRDVPNELSRLADVFEGELDVSMNLRKWTERFEAALAKPVIALHKTSFVYCIWKDPWMAVGKDTFIASMLEQAGYDLKKLWPQGPEKYPKFDIEKLPLETYVLLSSEPYPFAKKPPVLPHPNVEIIDGENYSWFGIRALRYLESLKG